MKFGTKVWITRGSGDVRPKIKGSLRRVRGILVGARKNERWVRLEQEDRLDTVGWSHRGQIGHWGSSAVIERK